MGNINCKNCNEKKAIYMITLTGPICDSDSWKDLQKFLPVKFEIYSENTVTSYLCTNCFNKNFSVTKIPQDSSNWKKEREFTFRNETWKVEFKFQKSFQK